ncbi:MlaA family lipoprotein [Aliamphritea ceti]|uniref:MlaA family lipoprotein n=1 Tax=Aliamphritea ceti TaxID=1524258 RepID=UPI0021C26DB4|nr:VacJ family lipoprotein [Aliamphritea ceti]
MKFASAALILSVLFSGLVSAQDESVVEISSEGQYVSDPWEGFNRAMFSFNDGLDTYALKPLAKGYQAVTPDVVETGVNNFFGNLSDVNSTLNALLQGKGEAAVESFLRFTFNTTIGIGGVFDVATPMGLPKHEEDFGQTFAAWGVGPGPYVVLPLFGPSTVRDGVGLIPDALVDPVNEVDHIRTRNSLIGLRIIDSRAQLFAAEELLTGDDRYVAVRDAYLQRREYQVNDGEIEADYDNDF